MQRASLSIFTLFVGLLLGACGLRKEPDEAPSDGRGVSTTSEDGPAEDEDDGDPAVVASPPPPETEERSYPRCEGATYTTAPSGAPCDVTRFMEGHGLMSPCYGPNIGTHCRTLLTMLTAAEPTPDGFVCDNPQSSGSRVCTWIFDQGMSSGRIDEAALEAVCGLLRAYPNKGVNCQVTSGS